ncbi:hypothetical protein H0H81_004051 [Sphagnurus paluster]|uniref:Protein BIG1 n=1 Tax=Sphagnurus paluster TaxID=117069 RepID=A0A9P7K7W5_9AGAR|nr:hypothetical protein H0H81_004051 [Sphagnurus paluster]
MTVRFLVAAALCPLVLAFSDTVPLIAWSSNPSKTLDGLSSNAARSRSLLDNVLSGQDICDLDAVILIEQEGLHASDLRTLSPSSKFAQVLEASPSQRQFQYMKPTFNLASTAESLAARCNSQLATLSLGSTPGHLTRDSKNVPSDPLHPASQLAEELASIAITHPHYIAIYTGSAPAAFAVQHAARQVFESVYAPGNTTLPTGGILKRYQLLTPGLITVLLITFFILVPIVLFGFKALASIQSPLRVEAPKGYGAQDKKNQ